MRLGVRDGLVACFAFVCFFFIIISPLKQIIGPIVSVSFESRNIPEQLPVGREKYEGKSLQIAGIDEKILKRN